MAQTAMQNLIKEIDERIEVINQLNQDRFTEGSLAYLNTIKKIATELLHKERQQIIDGYNQGYRDGENNTEIDTTIDVSECGDAHHYFTNTFNQ